MQQIIADAIVAGAVLFLLAWLYRNFVAKKSQEPACGSCGNCATKDAPNDQDQPDGAIPFKG